MSDGYRNDPRQLDLVDWLAGRTRKTDPKTSRAAAGKVNVRRLNTLVVNALRSGGPMTTEEIALVIRRRLQSVTPRMAPLANKGLIRNTGRTRRGSSNRDRILWEVVSEKESQGQEASVVGQDPGLSDLRKVVPGSPSDVC